LKQTKITRASIECMSARKSFQVSPFRYAGPRRMRVRVSVMKVGTAVSQLKISVVVLVINCHCDVLDVPCV
jgi:hypothetical protein